MKKLSIRESRTPSPMKKGGSPSKNPSPTMSAEKKGFPTTPRSIEKQKKILAARLKKAMDENIKLKAHNQCLKETNQKHL